MNETASDMFDVVLTGFTTGTPAEQAQKLAQAFGIPLETAARFVAQAPTIVSRSVPRVRADYFGRALGQIGATVEIRPTHRRAAASSPPQPAGPPQPTARSQTETTTARVTSYPPPAPVFGPADRAPGPAQAKLATAPVGKPGSSTIAMFQAAPEPVGAGATSPQPQPQATTHPPALEDCAPQLRPAAPPGIPSPGVSLQPTADSPLREASVVPFTLQATEIETNHRRPQDSPAQSHDAHGPTGAMNTVAKDPVPQVAKAGPDHSASGGQWGALMGLSEPDQLRLSSEAEASPQDVAAQPRVVPQGMEVSADQLQLEDDPNAPALELDFESNSSHHHPKPNANAPESSAGAPCPAPSTGDPAQSSPPSEPDAGHTGADSNPPGGEQPPEAANPVGSAVRTRLRVGYDDLMAIDGPNIERSLFEAFGVVFTTDGMAWMATLCIGFGLSFLVHHAALALPGWLEVGALLLGFSSSLYLVGLTAEFFAQVFWSSVKDQRRLAARPSLRPAYLTTGYLRAGLTLSTLALFGVAPSLVYVLACVATGTSNDEILNSTWLPVLLAAPLAYVPMALTTATMAHRILASWALPAGLRAILRAPLRYLVVMVGAGLATLLASGAFAAIAAITGQPVWWLATLGLPIGVGSAIAAAMMGHLVRDRADLFR